MGWYPVNKVKIERLTEPRVIRVVIENDVLGSVIHDYPYDGKMTDKEIDTIMSDIRKELFQIAM